MKKHLLRSLLVGVMTLAATGAWAAETWDFTNSSVWGSVALPTADNNSYSYNASGEAAETGNVVTFYSTTGAIVHPNTQTNGIGFSTVGSTSDHYVKVTVPAGYAASVTAYVSSNRNVSVTFGDRTDKYSANWADVTKDYDNTSGTEAVDLYIYASANAGGAAQAPYLRKIVLTSAVPVVTNYVDEEGNTLAPSVTEFVEVGVSFTPTYTSPLYVSDNDPFTYTYKSGAEPTTISGATTFTIVYSKADRPTYTITTVKNYGEKSESVDATVYEGANYTYYYPKFVLDGTTLYQYSSSTDANANTTYWTSPLSNVKADSSYTLTYTAKEGICIYYSEGEDIEGASLYENSTFVARSSNGGIGVVEAATLTTLPAGTYTLTARIIGRADRSVDFFTGSTSGTNILNAGSGTTGNESTSEEFTLGEATAIVANGGYVTTSENGHGIDYVYIMAKAAVKGVDVTVTEIADTIEADNDLVVKVKVKNIGTEAIERLNVKAQTDLFGEEFDDWSGSSVRVDNLAAGEEREVTVTLAEVGYDEDADEDPAEKPFNVKIIATIYGEGISFESVPQSVTLVPAQPKVTVTVTEIAETIVENENLVVKVTLKNEGTVDIERLNVKAQTDLFGEYDDWLGSNVRVDNLAAGEEREVVVTLEEVGFDEDAEEDPAEKTFNVKILATVYGQGIVFESEPQAVTLTPAPAEPLVTVTVTEIAETVVEN